MICPFVIKAFAHADRVWHLSIMAYNNTCNFHVIAILMHFFNQGVDQERMSVSCINIFLSIPTAFLNILLLISVLRKPSLRTSSNMFLCSLAFSDLGVAVVTEPSIAIVNLNNFYSNCHAMFYVIYLSSSLGTVSFLTIVASTVDCYLALKLHLLYSSHITTRVVSGVCVFIWFFGFSTGSMLIIWKGSVVVFLIGAIISTFIMLFCYIEIFLILRHHCNQIEAQMNSVQGPNVVNRLHLRKTVYNVVCIIAFFVLSYAPFVFSSLVVYIQANHTSIEIVKLWFFSVNIVCLNSLVNPLIYCWRMAEIRNAMKETLILGFTKIRDCCSCKTPSLRAF